MSITEQENVDAKDFRQELRELINGHSKENRSNTPDLVLAKFLDDVLFHFDGAVNERERLRGGPTPSEALYGFAAWITTRKERVVASYKDDAGVWAGLVSEFCEANNLVNPRDNYTDFFTMPRPVALAVTDSPTEETP